MILPKLSALILAAIAVVFIAVFILNVVEHKEAEKMKDEEAKRCFPHYINLVFIGFMLFVSFIVKVLLKSSGISTPCTAIIVMVGYIWGFIATHSKVAYTASSILQSSSEELLILYIPTLVFHLSFTLDIHIFFKTLPQVLVIGLFVSLTTALMFGQIANNLLQLEWDTKKAVLFGIFCLPILPTDILHLFKQQSIRTKQISVLLEGEAIFSFIVSSLGFALMIGAETGVIHKWNHYVLSILKMFPIGLVSGWLFGTVARFLIRKMYDERHSVIVIVCLLPFLVFSVSKFYLGGSGSVSVLMVGIMMNMERAVLDKQTEKYLLVFWEVINFLFNMFICMLVSMKYSIGIATSNEKWKDYSLTIGIFLSYYVTRFLCFLLFSPILSRIGYGMDLKNMLMCVWGGLKSPFILLAVDVLFEKINQTFVKKCYFHTTGFYFLSVLINGSFMDTILGFLDLKSISIARKININKCLKHIYQKREKTLTILRMERFLCDSNWELVKQCSALKHAYQLDLESDEDDDDDDDYLFKSYKFSYCPDCKKEVPDQPTRKEIREMTRQARLRVLKTKKMSYSRQYENGMITEEIIQILSQAVELAMDSSTYTIRIEDLQKQFTEENRFRKFIRKRAQNLAKKKKAKFRPPHTYWRRVCYHHVVTHRTFAKVMLLIVIVDLILLGIDFHYHPSDLFYPKPPEHDKKVDEKHAKKDEWIHHALLAYKIIFTAIYLIEFAIIIMAYSQKYICADGFWRYFKNFWHILDFVANVGYVWRLVSVIVYGLHKVPRSQRTCTDSLRMLRFLRFLRVVDIFYPDIINYLDRSADARMSFTYELGKSYVTGETEILNMLPYMIDNKTVLEDIKKKIEADRLLITKSLGVVQKERPWIAITVKTKQSIRTILNSMKQSITTLKSGGWIDKYETEKLMKEMNKLFKKVSSIKKVEPSPPKVIFKEVAWMDEDQRIIDFLYENVLIKNFEPGQVVFAEGDVADGIYIVVTGLFLLTYTPNDKVLSNLDEYGLLPIVDYLSGTKYQEAFVDYIVSGNCIGELSTLTQRPYNCVIMADTHSQVYVLSRGVLNRAMQLSPDPFTGLECRIWKEASIRVALPLLLQIPAYQAFSQDQIKYVLERAFVPNLTRYKIFVVNEVVENVVLIEGTVLDFNSRRLYTAPCCIPRTVQKLILPTSSLVYFPIEIYTKLLLIPEKDIDEYDVMQIAEDTCEMAASLSSSRCLQHIIQNRVRSRKRRRGRGPISARRRHADDMSSGITSMGTYSLGPEEMSSRMFFKTAVQEVTSVFIPSDEETEMKTFEPRLDHNSSIRFSPDNPSMDETTMRTEELEDEASKEETFKVWKEESEPSSLRRPESEPSSLRRPESEPSSLRRPPARKRQSVFFIS